ncbi:MAG: glycosyltransferase [Cyanobacteria bacterium]|nr:glycosyltransferase [Cyanobacteriota bacterium]
MMPGLADVRVYLFTYRRNHLLPRALNSLLAQTHTNWICEVHNDDPADPFPRTLVAQANDPRLIYVPHERNLGPTENFNHAFRPVREPFVSLLEDDNWWEPGLLAALLEAIRPHPSINVAWANSHLWRETETRDWERAGTIWPVEGQEPVTIFHLPDPRQACRAVHSHGAMVLRVTPDTMIPSPRSMPIVVIEPVRERAYPGPLLLVREPLANFAITRESWRTDTADENMQLLVLLALTLMRRCPDTADFYSRMWAACSGSRGHSQRSLVVAGAMAGRFWRVLTSAAPGELAVVAAWAILNPRRFAKLFAARERFAEVFEFLQAADARVAAAS